MQTFKNLSRSIHRLSPKYAPPPPSVGESRAPFQMLPAIHGKALTGLSASFCPTFSTGSHVYRPETVSSCPAERSSFYLDCLPGWLTDTIYIVRAICTHPAYVLIPMMKTYTNFKSFPGKLSQCRIEDGWEGREVGGGGDGGQTGGGGGVAWNCPSLIKEKVCVSFVYRKLLFAPEKLKLAERLCRLRCDRRNLFCYLNECYSVSIAYTGLLILGRCLFSQPYTYSQVLKKNRSFRTEINYLQQFYWDHNSGNPRFISGIFLERISRNHHAAEEINQH